MGRHRNRNSRDIHGAGCQAFTAAAAGQGTSIEPRCSPIPPVRQRGARGVRRRLRNKRTAGGRWWAQSPTAQGGSHRPVVIVSRPTSPQDPAAASDGTFRTVPYLARGPCPHRTRISTYATAAPNPSGRTNSPDPGLQGWRERTRQRTKPIPKTPARSGRRTARTRNALRRRRRREPPRSYPRDAWPRTDHRADICHAVFTFGDLPDRRGLGPDARNATGRLVRAQLAGPVLSWLCNTSHRPLRYVKVTPMTSGETR